MNAREALDLLDWKRAVFALYAEVRAAAPPEAWALWRERRDHLFATHPQSPLPEADRAAFTGLDLYDYDPAARTTGRVEAAPPVETRAPTSHEEEMVLTRVGTVRFELYGGKRSLDLFWVGGYGSGLFLPFRDATSGHATYGAGRYLYDTVKGADLGGAPDGSLVLDFNFAYNPSCAYDPRWACPLAPPANLLDVAVEAGERAPERGSQTSGS